MLFSESIAGRGIARLISWLGTAGPVDCFNRVFDCYNIRVYIQSFNFIGRVQATFGLVSHIARPIFCGGGKYLFLLYSSSLDAYKGLPIQGSPLSCVILRYTCI